MSLTELNVPILPVVSKSFNLHEYTCTIQITADCSPTDLKVDLPDGQVWRDLQTTVGYEFDGGNVTFNGIMNGSIATYTTYGDYLVSGGQTFHTTCHNNGWIHLPTIDITGFVCF